MKKIIIAFILLIALGLGGYKLYTINTSSQYSTNNTQGNTLQNVDMYGMKSESTVSNTGNTNRASTTSTTTNTTVNKTTVSNSTGSANQSTSVSVTEKTFTLADIARHSTGTSCYTTVRGKVYDLTSFINQHPGGSDKIMQICGVDGTNAFVDQHGGRPRQERELAGFQIGVLK